MQMKNDGVFFFFFIIFSFRVLNFFLFSPPLFCLINRRFLPRNDGGKKFSAIA